MASRRMTRDIADAVGLVGARSGPWQCNQGSQKRAGFCYLV